MMYNQCVAFKSKLYLRFHVIVFIFVKAIKKSRPTAMIDDVFSARKQPNFHRVNRVIAPCLKKFYFCIKHVGGRTLALGGGLHESRVGLEVTGLVTLESKVCGYPCLF